jgi:hypothetical protein
MIAPLAGILLLRPRVSSRKPVSKKGGVLATLTLVFTILGCVSCGGGLQGGGGGSGSPGTPTGTYTITITATSGAITHSTPVSLTVTP